MIIKDLKTINGSAMSMQKYLYVEMSLMQGNRYRFSGGKVNTIVWFTIGEKL